MADHLPCVIDIEASGFGRHSYPIEVGYVRDDGHSWCSLIRPDDSWTHWDATAEQAHGISRDMLLRHGRPPLEVANHLNDDLTLRTVYCDGWAHDYTWLALLFEVAGVTPRFRLESINALLDDPGLARLDKARADAFSALGVHRHRASSDARALQWAVGRVGHAPPAPPVWRRP